MDLTFVLMASKSLLSAAVWTSATLSPALALSAEHAQRRSAFCNAVGSVTWLKLALHEVMNERVKLATSSCGPSRRAIVATAGLGWAGLGWAQG